MIDLLLATGANARKQLHAALMVVALLGCVVEGARAAGLQQMEQVAGTATEVLDPTQVAGVDMLDKIRNLLQEKGPGHHTVKVPPGRYVINTPLYLGSHGLSDYVIDMTGATFTTTSREFTPFLTDSPVKDIHLIGGHFITSPSGVRFASCLGGYSDASHAINGLEVAFEECAGTTAEGIVLHNPVVDGAAGNCRNVSIHDVYVHDTGRQSINVGYCMDVEVARCRLVNPALNGPSDTDGQAANLQVYASGANLHDNDISGTPYWIKTPTSFNVPASGIYLWGEDIRIVHNLIHDSKCTEALCDQHGRTGNIGVVDAGKPFPFGGTAENYAGVDGVHLDTVNRAQITDNTISGYSTGVTVEVSRHVDVTQNKIEKIYRNALYDSSRYQVSQINALNSVAGLNGGAGVSLGLSSQCGGAAKCVTVSTRTGVPVGSVLLSQHGSEANPFDGTNLFPQMKVSSTADLKPGALSLVLSNTLACDRSAMADPTSVVMPFGAIHKGTFGLEEFAFSYARMYFLHLGGKKSTEQRFLSWCVVTNAPLPAQGVTLTVSDFKFSLNSEFNRWERNRVAGTGQFGVLVSGCGRDTVFKGNTLTDVAYGDYAYNAYGWLLTMFIGNENCKREGLVFSGNHATPSRELERRFPGAGALSAIALGGTGSRKEQPFGEIQILNNVVRDGSGKAVPRLAYSTDPRGLQGIAPKLKEAESQLPNGGR